MWLKVTSKLIQPSTKNRAAPIPGICIGIGPIPAIFDGIGISQVCYTSTNSVVCALLTMK